LGDEFVGPFASWVNLKQQFGAVGDGVTDDTNAIQAALNALRTAGNSPVLYVPAGTYRITSTVTLVAASSVSIIGADPTTTTLKWGGAANGILFHIDGVQYGRYDRITFDGNGTAGVLVDQSMTGTSQGQYFDTGNEYADDVFRNAAIGIQGGQYGQGASESSVLRSQFLNLTTAGIILRNFNALDWWVWYSYFQNNRVGISNNPGAGNFHAFNNFFTGSTYADLDLLNTGNFNFRDNFSLNSNMFLIEEFYYTNAAVTRVSGNTVVEPANGAIYVSGGTTYFYDGSTIYNGNMGPLVMNDNLFFAPPGDTRTKNGKPLPVVAVAGTNPPDGVSIGDTYYNASSTLNTTGYASTPGRSIISGDQVLNSTTVPVNPPALPVPLPNYNRPIIDVPTGSSTSAIQNAINQAVALNGQRPIVHLPFGVYNITQTLSIPANSDLQLVGDGSLQTRLTWSGTGSGPVLLLQGPSRAILRDFYVNAGSVTGIDVQNADQQGSRVYMQQPLLGRASVADLFVDSLDYTLVELQNFDLTATPGTTGVGLQVVGGPLAQQGNPQYGRTNLFAGGVGSNSTALQVSQGASLLVRDSWYEEATSSTYAQVSNNSSFTVEGSRIASPIGAGNIIQVNNFTCNVAIMANAPNSGISVGQGSGNVWVLGNNFGTATSYFVNLANTSSAFFNLNRYYGSNGSMAIADTTAIPAANFISTVLAQSRAAHPSQIMDLTAGITDVRFYRISTELGTIGIHLER